MSQLINFNSYVTNQIELMQLSKPTWKQSVVFLNVLTFVILCLPSALSAQTQAPSINTGVTFQWENTQTNNSDPATIRSVTVDSKIYRAFAVPTSYAMTQVGPDGHDKNSIFKNGAVVNDDSSNSNWNADALKAFKDKNLNHYFESVRNGISQCGNFGAVGSSLAQVQSLYYNPGIPSNDGGLLAITERSANNCYYVSVYGTPAGGGPEQFLGDTFVRPNTTQWGPLFNAPPTGVDYWNSGRVVENNGTIGIALFVLDALAPIGSVITQVNLMAATVDHGDGKAFILQEYAVPKIEIGCIDKEYEGTVGGTNNVPVGSTFSLVSGPIPAGQSFTFNPDGSYIYRPTPGYNGNVVFEYEVCLPAPNTGVCDSATVTLDYSADCDCSSGNADGPMLQN